MKRLSLIILLLAISTSAHAWDGEIYFGKFFNQVYRAAPDETINAEWISGIEIGHDLKWFRPWANIETLMDGWADSGKWHPASIRYSTGLTFFLPHNIEIEASHMCWHPVDRLAAGRWSVEEYDLIKLIIKF